MCNLHTHSKRWLNFQPVKSRVHGRKKWTFEKLITHDRNELERWFTRRWAALDLPFLTIYSWSGCDEKEQNGRLSGFCRRVHRSDKKMSKTESQNSGCVDITSCSEFSPDYESAISLLFNGICKVLLVFVTRAPYSYRLRFILQIIYKELFYHHFSWYSDAILFTY